MSDVQQLAPIPPLRGRKTTFSHGVADAICDRLAQGESLRAICETEDYPPESTVRRWVIDDVQGFAAQYTGARDIGLDCRADRLLDIAETATDAALGRLKMDANRWYLSKLAPKRYGDKQVIDHTSSDGSMSPDAAVDKLAALVSQVRERT